MFDVPEFKKLSWIFAMLSIVHHQLQCNRHFKRSKVTLKYLIAFSVTEHYIINKECSKAKRTKPLKRLIERHTVFGSADFEDFCVLLVTTVEITGKRSEDQTSKIRRRDDKRRDPGKLSRDQRQRKDGH